MPAMLHLHAPCTCCKITNENFPLMCIDVRLKEMHSTQVLFFTHKSWHGARGLRKNKNDNRRGNAGRRKVRVCVCSRDGERVTIDQEKKRPENVKRRVMMFIVKVYRPCRWREEKSRVHKQTTGDRKHVPTKHKMSLSIASLGHCCLPELG